MILLGSTGSIGVNTLNIARKFNLNVEVLVAGRNIELLNQQIQEFKPKKVVIDREQDISKVNHNNVSFGENAILEAIEESQTSTIVNALVGFLGLKPTLKAIECGKKIALANKETLVVAGELICDLVQKHNSAILPVDSEHSAIFQCLVGEGNNPIEKLILTASGGPFRNTPLSELHNVTPEAACAHPNWVMGRKISVDSASMMNKGLEVIEAHWLFAAPPEQIQVVVHPQSVIHSLVEYTDGSVLAQLGNPDMRTPIAYALAYPERIAAGVEPLDLFKIAHLDFHAPDFERFPCLRLAYDALSEGGTAPAILNAANEVAVAAFLERQLPFLGIPRLIAATLDALPSGPEGNLSDVLAADAEARHLAAAIVKEQRFA